VGEQGIWRISTNQEVRELYKYVDIAAGFKKKRVEWIPHVARMGLRRTFKKIFESKTEGSRRRARPRLR
jgi:hypothetical protein